jgi:hypothetical protein
MFTMMILMAIITTCITAPGECLVVIEHNSVEFGGPGVVMDSGPCTDGWFQAESEALPLSCHKISPSMLSLRLATLTLNINTFCRVCLAGVWLLYRNRHEELAGKGSHHDEIRPAGPVEPLRSPPASPEPPKGPFTLAMEHRSAAHCVEHLPLHDNAVGGAVQLSQVVGKDGCVVVGGGANASSASKCVSGNNAV